MPYNKFTDEQIIKALKCIEDEDEIPCAECAFANVETAFRCRKIVAKAAIDFIKRQQEEIERITLEYAGFKEGVNHFADIGKMYSEVRAEAIREFAERLKNRRGTHGELWGGDIDNLVKEMTEDKS